MTPNAIKVKIGTRSAKVFPLLRRRPKGHLLPASRDVPKPGEVFYIVGSFGVPLALRCTDIKPDLGPLYYAEKV
jgi:hypothetical protein